jgi:hypothetical protein
MKYQIETRSQILHTPPYPRGPPFAMLSCVGRLQLHSEILIFVESVLVTSTVTYFSNDAHIEEKSLRHTPGASVFTAVSYDFS